MTPADLVTAGWTPWTPDGSEPVVWSHRDYPGKQYSYLEAVGLMREKGEEKGE